MTCSLHLCPQSILWVVMERGREGEGEGGGEGEGEEEGENIFSNNCYGIGILNQSVDHSAWSLKLDLSLQAHPSQNQHKGLLPSLTKLPQHCRQLKEL